VGADNAYDLLVLAAELEFGPGKKPVHYHVVALDAGVDELAIALGADHPEWRQFALADAARKLDEHLVPVVESAQRPPGRIVALDPIAEIQRIDVDAGGHGPRRFSSCILLAKSDELVLRVSPGDRGHIGLLVRMQLEVIGPAVGIDDEIGDEIGPRRLDEDVDALHRASAALGGGNDIEHQVARGDGPGTDELLARLKCDVSDLAWRGIDLVERAIGEGINLDGVEVSRPRRLNTRRAIRLIDTRVWVH